MKRNWILVLVFCLAAMPAFAGGVVQSGTDLWVTPADGSTYSDFASNPIPAGFFCGRSAAFTGRIAFKGAPLATDSPGILRNSDTVIERLDNAEFDSTGKAVTRLQVKAINLVSIAPVKTACGDFNVRASLAGDQPITRMRIFKDDESGGRFLAPLALNVKLTFTPVGRTGRALELGQKVRFPADPRATWVADNNKAAGRFLRIDTNGDGRADTLVPGPSNFRAGQRAMGEKVLYEEEFNPGFPIDPTIDPSTPGYYTVHTSPSHVHYVAPPPPCGGGGGRFYEEFSPIGDPCLEPIR